MTEDPEKTWREYCQRKKAERIAEASVLWELMREAGVTGKTALALDFVHVGTSRSDIENLAKQLSESYEMQVVPSEDQGYWLAKGTTRPYGISLNQEQHLGWVEFMADVAQSYGCVFSTWSLEAPSLGAHFHSENVESSS